MAKTMHFIVVSVILGVLLQNVNSLTVGNGGELFDTLLARIESLEANDAANKALIGSLEASEAANKKWIESLVASEAANKVRIELLEASDAANKAKIAEMELKIDGMEKNFKLKESALLGKIKELATTLISSNGDSQDDQLRANDAADRSRSGPHTIQRRENNIRKYRDAPETEVAFYATHQSHDIHHLGSNQILQFPVDVTNIGHAYNNNTGGFTAPVDGTYVIHATVMGIDVEASAHTKAHFDVNGTVYSKFYVTPYDQSSQMLVVELKAGDTVSVRNDYTDTGFIGQHYTTFSGFLLYQNYPSGAVVGK